MQKLLYLLNQRFPTEKAYGIQVTKMCEAFKANAIDTELVVPTRKNRYQGKSEIPYTKLYSPDFYFPASLDRIAFWIKNVISAMVLTRYAMKSKANVIYSREELPLYVLSFFRKNLVFEAHNFSMKRKSLYTRLTKIITITESLKQDFVAFGIPAKNILVAHDAYDPKDFEDLVPDATMRHPLVLYAGARYHHKGAHIFEQAAALVPEATFYVASGLPHRKALSLMLAADVLVLPNTGDMPHTSPLKLFEYMAAKKPIVASRLPAICEILDDQSAVLVEPANPHALADGIKSILTGKKLTLKTPETWDQRAKKIITFLS